MLSWLKYPEGLPKLQAITRSYTIAFTMRSGSNAICSLLARNGLGIPGEWFQTHLVASEGESWRQSFDRFTNEHQANGVFGSKMSHDHRAALDESLRAVVPGYRQLDDVLPAHRWVSLVRRDKILQAISLCRAEVSGQWAEGESRARRTTDYPYDFFHILSRVTGIQSAELAYELYFQKNNIKPLVIVYEDFFEDVGPQLRRLVDHLGGLPEGRDSLEMEQGYRVQRDELNYAIRERFVSDLIRIGEKSLIAEIGPSWDRWVRFFTERQWQVSQTSNENAATADSQR